MLLTAFDVRGSLSSHIVGGHSGDDDDEYLNHQIYQRGICSRNFPKILHFRVCFRRSLVSAFVHPHQPCLCLHCTISPNSGHISRCWLKLIRTLMGIGAGRAVSDFGPEERCAMLLRWKPQRMKLASNASQLFEPLHCSCSKHFTYWSNISSVDPPPP